VHENEGDLLALQDLLDRSFASAGHHLLEVITPDCRLTAPEVCDRLQGVRLLALANATRTVDLSSDRWTVCSSEDHSTSARHRTRSRSGTYVPGPR
jgi:hypothetical protein